MRKDIEKKEENKIASTRESLSHPNPSECTPHVSVWSHISHSSLQSRDQRVCLWDKRFQNLRHREKCYRMFSCFWIPYHRMVYRYMGVEMVFTKPEEEKIIKGEGRVSKWCDGFKKRNSAPLHNKIQWHRYCCTIRLFTISFFRIKLMNDMIYIWITTICHLNHIFHWIHSFSSSVHHLCETSYCFHIEYDMISWDRSNCEWMTLKTVREITQESDSNVLSYESVDSRWKV